MINTKVADDQKNNEKKKGNDNDDDVKEWDGKRCTGCRATAVSASICKSHSTASCTEANLQCNCVHLYSVCTVYTPLQSIQYKSVVLSIGFGLSRHGVKND